MEALILAAIAYTRTPEAQKVISIFVWLCSINAGFWILARVMSAFVDVFSELFFEELWGAFATVYNIALAVFFAAILFVSAIKGSPPKDLLWRQGCGFVLLYLSLGAAYMEANTHQINQYARPGYLLGLISYILFAAFPRIVAYPELYTLITVMKAVADSWVGTAFTIFVVGGIVIGIARKGLGEMFHHLSPALWYVGALKHPPIRIRREK